MLPEYDGSHIAWIAQILLKLGMLQPVSVELARVVLQRFFSIEDPVEQLDQNSTRRALDLGVGLELALVPVGTGLISHGQGYLNHLWLETSSQHVFSSEARVLEDVMRPAGLADFGLAKAEPERYCFDTL